MRSILSRFTLFSVAALALSGLIAGCSGGTSSSLPATSSGVAGGGSITVAQMQAKFLQQMRTHSFPVAQLPMANSRPMSAKGLAQMRTLLNALRHQKVHQGSVSTGAPGGFGFVTTTSPPGPYAGMFSQMAAYLAAQFSVGRGPYLNSDLLAPINVAPGGACLIPFVHYNRNFFGGFSGEVTNTFGVYDECGDPGIPQGTEYFLDFPGFGGKYINPAPAPGTPPTINAVVVSDSAPGSPGASWSIKLFNFMTSVFETVPILGPSVGSSNLTAGGGFSGWDEADLAPQLCPLIPTSGIGAVTIQLLNTTNGKFDPLAPSLAGGGFSAFAPPNTVSQRCFTNDGSHLGQEFQINGGGVQPFYTSAGGNWLVTSFPSP